MSHRKVMDLSEYFADVSEEWEEKDRILHLKKNEPWGRYWTVYVLGSCKNARLRQRFDAQCHADLRQNLNDSSYALNGAYHNGDPVGRAYLDFILDPVESPWAKLIAQFKEYKVYDWHDKGLYVYMAGLQGLSLRLVWNFMVAHRGFGERPDRIRTWHKLVTQHGWDKRKAFAFVNVFESSVGTTNVWLYTDPGHWPTSGCMELARLIDQNPHDLRDVSIGQKKNGSVIMNNLIINVVWGYSHLGSSWGDNTRFRYLLTTMRTGAAKRDGMSSRFFKASTPTLDSYGREHFNIDKVAVVLADVDLREYATYEKGTV